MPARIKLFRQRLAITRMAVWVVRAIAKEYLGTDMAGSVADDVLLVIAIFIGQAERRPMTAAKLADYAGMPRATVVRKLRELKARGLVELTDGHATLPTEKLNAPGLTDAVAQAAREIHRLAANLSKMDAEPIADD